MTAPWPCPRFRALSPVIARRSMPRPVRDRAARDPLGLAPQPDHGLYPEPARDPTAHQARSDAAGPTRDMVPPPIPALRPAPPSPLDVAHDTNAAVAAHPPGSPAPPEHDAASRADDVAPADTVARTPVGAASLTYKGGTRPGTRYTASADSISCPCRRATYPQTTFPAASPGSQNRRGTAAVHPPSWITKPSRGGSQKGRR